MGNYTIFAYFNSTEIYSILNSVVMMMGSGGPNGDYLTLLKSLGIVGLLIAICTGIVRARGEDGAIYLIFFALFYFVLFVPRVSVTIEEKGGRAMAPMVVDNVPLGLAFFASFTSHIGYWLTNVTETVFSLPDTELKMSQHGVMGGPRALKEAQSARMPDPILAADFSNFMRDCINPELVSSPSTVQSLLTSTEIWEDFEQLFLINPGRMVTLAGEVGAVSCTEAYYSKIGSRLNPAVQSELARIAQRVSPYATQAMANLMLRSMLPASEGMIMTASGSAEDSLKQRIMINMLQDTGGNLAQIMNDPTAALVAQSYTVSTQQANIAYLNMGKMAENTLPMMRNSIELIILGLFPIILVLILVAGTKGGLVLKTYVMTMFWVQLWAPLYAIVNFVGTIANADKTKSILGGVDGIAVSNAADFLNTTISSEAMAGLLTITVPMIAYAVVKGGEVAMSGVTSSLINPANSMAQKAGSEAAMGNFSAGNLSWGNQSTNNLSANKSRGGFGYEAPDTGSVSMGDGSYDINERGGIVNPQLKIGNMGTSLSSTQGTNATATKSSGKSADLTSTSDTSLTNGTSGRYSSQEYGGFDAQLSKQLQERFGGEQNASSNYSAKTDRNNRTGTDLSQAEGATSNYTANSSGKIGFNSNSSGAMGTARKMFNLDDAGNTASGAASGKGGSTSGTAASRKTVSGSADLSHGLNVQTGESSKDEASKTQGTSEQESIGNTFQQVRSAVMGVSANIGTSGAQTAGRKFMADLASAIDGKYGTSLRSSLSENASEGTSQNSSTGVNASTNYGNQAANAVLKEHGGNVGAAFRAMQENPSSASAGAVGTNLASNTVNSSGESQGLTGPISAPKSVADQHSQGQGAVSEQAGQNIGAASAGGGAMLDKARSQQSMPVQMPNLDKAREATKSVDGEVQTGMSNTGDRVQLNSGIRLAAAALHDGDSGMGRLMKNTYGGGLLDYFGLNSGGQEFQQNLSRLADQNPEIRSALKEMANHGQVTPESAQKLGQGLENVKQGLDDQYGNDWREGAGKTVETAKNWLN